MAMIGRRPLFITEGIFAAFDLLSPIEVLIVLKKMRVQPHPLTQLVKLLENYINFAAISIMKLD